MPRKRYAPPFMLTVREVRRSRKKWSQQFNYMKDEGELGAWILRQWGFSVGWIARRLRTRDKRNLSAIIKYADGRITKALWRRWSWGIK
jgi:hypothetical protein